jgi:hypothetical protein
MTPERMAGLVARWVRLYTQNLPSAVARRRIEELDADLHDHIAHERAAGTAERRIARSLAARMVRGLPADVSWRGRMVPMSITRSARRVALLTLLVLLVPLVAMQVTDGVAWTVADFVLAGVLLAGTGVLYELVLRRPRSLVYRAIATVIGVAAVVAGEADDAPGLVGFGCLVILSTIVLALRPRRAGERDPAS